MRLPRQWPCRSGASAPRLPGTCPDERATTGGGPLTAFRCRRFCKERYDDVNQFERHLVRNGTIVLEFFLHISKVARALVAAVVTRSIQDLKLKIAVSAERRRRLAAARCRPIARVTR